MKLRITISNRQRFLRPDRARLRKALSRILRAGGREGTLSVALVSDRAIRRVHRRFLDEDTPTDVISFSYEEEEAQAGRGASGPGGAPGGPFGELVISAETALREAQARGISPQLELLRYAVHGTLHLLGHDDATPRGRRRMRALERRYLRESAGPARDKPRPPRRGGRGR